MAVQKKSDGIRKKGEPRIARGEIMRDESRRVSDEMIQSEPHIISPRGARREPQEPAFLSVHKSAAQSIPPDDGASADEPDESEESEDSSAGSEFLDHWRMSQESSEQAFRYKEYASLPAKIARIGKARAPGTGRSRLARWGMISGGLAVAAALLFVSTAGASLTIAFKPRVDDIALQDIAVAFDTSVAKVLIPQKVIPAEALSFSKKSEQTFTATGKRQIAERARGKAAIVNSFSSSPQILVAGTRLVTDAGLLFRLPKFVTVPGAKIEEGKIMPQSVEVDLVADAPGEGSNIAGKAILKIPGFKGTPRYDGFFATASGGFAGGFQGEAPVVSGDDLKNAQEQVTKALFDDLRSDIGRKIPPGFTALKELQNIEIKKVAAPAVGMHTEQFSVSADAVAKAIVFRQDDAIVLIKAFALADSTDQELVDGSADLQYHSRSIDFDKGRAEMTISGSVKIKAVVRGEELAALVAGKKSGSIADALHSRPELANFALAFFPPWRASAPSDPSRIRFRQE